MKSTRVFSFFVILLMAFRSKAWAKDTTREIVVSPDSDYFGFDLRSVENVSLDQCKQACLDDVENKLWSQETADLPEVKEIFASIARLQYADKPDSVLFGRSRNEGR